MVGLWRESCRSVSRCSAFYLYCFFFFVFPCSLIFGWDEFLFSLIFRVNFLLIFALFRVDLSFYVSSLDYDL